MTFDNRNYNKLTQMPQMPYLMISEILTDNDDIWKLLQYNEANALDQPNLTNAQKRAMIYNGSGDESNSRVFTNLFINDSFNEVQTQIRVDVSEVRPDNYVYAQLNVGILILAHNSIMTLNNYENRTTRILHELIKTLNGIEINGIGKLVFDRDRHESVLAKKMKINNYFSGYILYMNVISA